MRKDIDNVEIKEPPLEELKKKHSCFQRSCANGCGCVIILIVTFLIILKFAAAPRPKELKNVPEHFPQSIPIYDEDSIERITFLSGAKKSRAFEIAAYLPKIILIPIYLGMDDYAPEEIRATFQEINGEKGWKKFLRLLQEPITKQKDTIEIEWNNLSAEPSFVQKFYTTELGRGMFNLETTTETETTIQLIFDKDGINGALYINDNKQKSGTDYAVLTINMPSK
ncbi:MAG: hypothetical protein WC862_04445 [Patescibacteria group bacterium]